MKELADLLSREQLERIRRQAHRLGLDPEDLAVDLLDRELKSTQPKSSGGKIMQFRRASRGPEK
ncbi:hypothetical protein [Microbulbifer celer]|uniref:Uncharacterized protein n=1 Tax=Microbulbifer celer TaxID=435905 RepID=A0ABW3U6B6_9GAMM|nr:hypothetical protein [Microbulbifer celer]UFN58558.1 hypothetical protein LPW13_05815 [Microbulbifer celer]